MSTLIELQSIYLSDGGRNIINDVSLKVKRDEIMTIIGPNGAGKSSLIKLITGLEKADSGTIMRKPRLRIGYMPQQLVIDANMPINAKRFLSLSTRDKQAIKHCIDKLSLQHFLQTPLQQLSGGELQRLLLARAIIRKPELLVLDEPTQGVDITGQVELYRIISQLRDELHCGVIMVSHDLHLVMAKTDTVVCLNHHICCYGEPESVSQHPEYLQLFSKESAQDIAVYTHHHDHEHNLKGDVVNNPSSRKSE